MKRITGFVFLAMALAIAAQSVSKLDQASKAVKGQPPEPPVASVARGLIDQFGNVITNASTGSATARSVNAGDVSAVLAADGNNSTPVITETYVSEIFVPCNMTVTGVALFNGSDVTGNVTVGLADASGAVIAGAKSASTAGSGTDAYQLVPFTSSYLAKGPAVYYIQVQYSSATARYNTFAVGKHGVTKQTSQTYGTLTSFTPPTTFTTAIGNICGLY